MNENNNIKFWGVRGSIPAPEINTLKYGGNTSCVSIEYNNYFLIFDAGSGIRKLGQYLSSRKDIATIKGSVFLTHTHWDHIQGLPFFIPVFRKENKFHIFGESKKKYSLPDLLEDQMQAPFFPISMNDLFKAKIKFIEVTPEVQINYVDNIRIIPIKLNHPNSSIGYIAEIAGVKAAYITDNELSEDDDAFNLISKLKNVDILIHDSQYTKKEIKNEKKGWGHSAWEDVVELSQKAAVKKVFLYHHDPDKTDDELDELQYKAQTLYKNTFVAREGLKIPLF